MNVENTSDVPSEGSKPVDPCLVRAAQQGDALAMDELLSRLIPFVSTICRQISHGDAADAIQETLLAVFCNVRRLRAPEALLTWVRVIATREAVRIARRRLPEPDMNAVMAVPERTDHELAIDVYRVLERLTPQHRAVLILREIQGLDDATIASILKIPCGTVKSRLSRARLRFRMEWQAEW